MLTTSFLNFWLLGHLSLVETDKRPVSADLATAYGQVLGVDKPQAACSLDDLADTLTTTRQLEDETNAAYVLPSVHAQRRLVDNLKRESRATGLASEVEQYLGWLHIPTGRGARPSGI